MRLPLFILKYSHFEYWPWWLFYLPVLPYWMILSIRNKSLAYFSVANPGIELGGFFGESKSEILKLIPNEYLPLSITVQNMNYEDVCDKLQLAGIPFPLIAKPDVGERGNGVAKINNHEELLNYHRTANGKYILQEFVTYNIELGVLYSRLPGSENGEVTSITRKEFLSVTGDGRSTIEQLLQKSTRARFQLKRLKSEMGEEIYKVPAAHETRILEPIGNHCRGTRFVDNNFLINQNINQVFDKISLPIEGFYYGRFDLKVKSIEDFYKGKNIKIMELNGASSEPGHIYDSKNKLWKAYRDLLKHWKKLADISRANMLAGHKPVKFSVIVNSYLKFVVFKKTNPAKEDILSIAQK